MSTHTYSAYNNNRYMREFSYMHRYQYSDNRDWRQNSSYHNTREAVIKASEKKEFKKRAYRGVFAMIVIVVIMMFLLYLLFVDNTTTTTRICVPGFVGEHCDRSNFIGTYFWSTNDFYTLDDGLQHRNGLAFRVYAPNAAYVLVNVKSPGSMEVHYNMTYVYAITWTVDLRLMVFGLQMLVQLGPTAFTTTRFVT